MDNKELINRLRAVVRELASIENDDEAFVLTIDECSQLCDMRRKLRRIADRIQESEDNRNE